MLLERQFDPDIYSIIYEYDTQHFSVMLTYKPKGNNDSVNYLFTNMIVNFYAIVYTELALLARVIKDTIIWTFWTNPLFLMQ